MVLFIIYGCIKTLHDISKGTARLRIMVMTCFLKLLLKNIPGGGGEVEDGSFPSLDTELESNASFCLVPAAAR